MDKKELLRKSLAEIMENQLEHIQNLVKKYPVPTVIKKADGSPVTPLDLELSDLIECITQENFGESVHFYSEEKFNLWRFPMMVVDPLDGTKEYIAGRSEWALSLALLHSEKLIGEGWVYNPVTGECFAVAKAHLYQAKSEYFGEVSRSECERGLFEKAQGSKFSVKAMGSIAYKLGRLSAGKCDFVVSLRPKNIWDIAGGTLLCQQAGLRFYSQGKEVTEVKKLYEPPLIWCHEELFPELSALFP